MANYQRFQILSAARQDLFDPESPVWVSRYQLSRDLESGKRLLQTRMVNCSEKTVRQVFLRVVCLGTEREKLAQLELVPMPVVSARPGRVFGDDKLTELTVKGTVFAEVYVQRVRFADDSTWDETDQTGYLAFRAEPMRREDPHYETLADRARSGGVRNDCYFKAQQGLWVCTCGLPNALRGRRCVRCGADRVWLESHMDPNLIDAPAPEKEPAPAPIVYPSPAPAVTVVPAPFREEPAPAPTIILQSPPEPEAEEAPASHAGRNAAIVAAVLLFLALGAFCAYKYLMPYLRYREALSARSAGNYDKAVSLFQELGEYRDSPEKIQETLLQKARSLMAKGSYQEAMELFSSLNGHEAEAADCLYAMGVLAYNDKDLTTALDYVEQLRERFPDYDKTDELANYCWYSLGLQTAALAADEQDPAAWIAAYRGAQDQFAQAGGYEDSAQRIQDCLYQIAKTYMEEGDYPKAIAQFIALQDYQDSREQLQACQFAYASAHIENPDQVSLNYLNSLAAENYPGAQELLDRLNGVGFQFDVLYSSQPNAQPTPITERTEVTDLSGLSISYRVEIQDDEGAVLVLVRCKLPDGQESRTLLNSDRSARNSRSWADLSFPGVSAAEGPVTLSFYDAARGENSEPLATVSFRLTHPKQEDPDQDSETNQDKEKDKDMGSGNTQHAEPQAPGTGR